MDVALVTDVKICDAVVWPRDQIVYKGHSLAEWGQLFNAESSAQTCPGKEDSKHE